MLQATAQMEIGETSIEFAGTPAEPFRTLRVRTPGKRGVRRKEAHRIIGQPFILIHGEAVGTWN